MSIILFSLASRTDGNATIAKSLTKYAVKTEGATLISNIENRKSGPPNFAATDGPICSWDAFVLEDRRNARELPALKTARV